MIVDNYSRFNIYLDLWFLSFTAERRDKFNKCFIKFLRIQVFKKKLLGDV